MKVYTKKLFISLIKGKLFLALILSFILMVIMWFGLNKFLILDPSFGLKEFSADIPTFISTVIFLLLSLIMLTVMATRNQFMAESENKRLLAAIEDKNKEKINYFKRLNDACLAIMSEINLNELLDKILEVCMAQSHSERGAIFFLTNTELGRRVSLFRTEGYEDIDFSNESFSVEDLLEISSYRNILDNKESDSDKIANFLFSKPQDYQNWIIAPIYSRFNSYDGISIDGLVILSRTLEYSETTISLIQSIVANARISVENARLMKKAEEASSAKSAFLANMSHEIRTPLGVIIGFSEMLIKNKFSDKKKYELVHNIKKNGKQLTRLIDDILDISKIEAGKIVIQRNKLDFLRLINEVHFAMLMRANSKDVTFEVSNQGIIPVHIRTDEVRLKQILINVISNAIKFTEKGTVALAIRCLTDDVTREKKIEFIVRDTGVGISSTAKSGLFEAFNQGDVSTTRKFGGTGLGLALSRKIARALGGDLSLEYSEPGKGTVFKILIELDEVEGTEWADSWDGDKMNEFAKDYLQESLLRPLEAKNILLVEDSPDNQEIFQYFLTEAGANVKISKDGIEAVEEATRGNYDIVLMDIQLPRMDGKEATWRLRQQGFNKPIIALTAHAMIEEVKSCLMAGCNGQITKPVTRDSLISDVQYYLTY